MNCYYYFINIKTNKYRNLLKKRNVKLNYSFIKFMAHDCSLHAFKWILNSLDYINQYVHIDRDYIDISCNYYDLCRCTYNLPNSFEDFIFEYLLEFECDDFNLSLPCDIAYEKVKIMAKNKININKNNLLEKIYIETEGMDKECSLYNVFLLISLFVLNDNLIGVRLIQ